MKSTLWVLPQDGPLKCFSPLTEMSVSAVGGVTYCQLTIDANFSISIFLQPSTPGNRFGKVAQWHPLTASRFIFLDETMCSLKASLSSWGTCSRLHSCWIFSRWRSHVASFCALHSSSWRTDGEPHRNTIHPWRRPAFQRPGTLLFSPDRWAVSVILCFLWRDKTPPRPRRPRPSRSLSQEPCPVRPCTGRSASWGLWTLPASSPVKENQSVAQLKKRKSRVDVTIQSWCQLAGLSEPLTFSAFWLLTCCLKFSSSSSEGTQSGEMPYGMEQRTSHRSWSCSCRSLSCCIRQAFSFCRASTCVRMFFSCWSMLMAFSSWRDTPLVTAVKLRDLAQNFQRSQP